MFAALLTAAYAPFAIAFVVMVGIGLIEALGLGVGTADTGHAIDGDVADGGLLSWLGVGDLPILVWLTALLGCFVFIGLAIQQLATVTMGAPLSAPVAAGAALTLGLTLNTFVANGLARILPGYESSAVSTDELVRSRGTILEGAARRGHPARAKVVDRHGQAHYVMVEPHADDGIIPQGQTALLVRREGSTYFGLPDASPLEPLSN